MTETPKEAARRLSAHVIAKGFKPVALHTYTDTRGEPLYWRIRAKHPDTGEKWIRPMKLNGSGYELGEPKFSDGKPLYALHRIATNPDAGVWVAEGEQKADALNKLGLVATTSSGATSAPSADWEPLRGRNVTIWPDNDDPGKGYAGEVASKLLGMGCKVSCLDVDKLGLGEGEDVMQWLTKHPEATRADIEALPRLATESAANDTAGVVFRCMANIEAKPIDWLWPGKIARGKVTMLAGNPGLGKSQVTASLAAIITTGGQWPVDRIRCKPGSVVFLSAEDDAADTIKPRLLAAGADVGKVFVVDAVQDGFNAAGEPVARHFNLKADLGKLGALLDRLSDVAMIVIDPVTAYLGDTDSHKNAEVRALLAPLGELAARYGAAVVCVSHLNKGGNSEALMRVTGSLAFVAAARAAFIVARDQDDTSRRLFLPLKNNIGKDETGLAFRVESHALPGGIETSCIAWEPEAVTVTADEALLPEGSADDRSEREEAADWLREILTDGPQSSKDLQRYAKDAGIAWATVRRAKDALGIKSAKTRFDGGWEWALPSKMLKGAQDAHTKTVSTFEQVEHLREAEEERAAIMEHDGGMSRDDAERLAAEPENRPITGKVADGA
jgi:hypothetical protein